MTGRAFRSLSVSIGLTASIAACGSSGSTSEKAAATTATTTTTVPLPSTSTTTAGTTEFCKIMTQAAARLEPDAPDAQPAPAETKREFDEIAAVLAKAEVAAPPALTADIARFATAIDKYRAALAAVGYNLGAIYSTPEGIALAGDTSHALSPAVVRHMTGPCGIKPNGGEERAP